MELISIIVPVYNVEKFISTCVDSILGQTYGSFELLLIDDGSTDMSGTICDQFAHKDSRIKVFHKTNGGVSNARNVGLENAKGKYLYFSDADDYLEEDLLECLINSINGTDMSVCGYFKDIYDHGIIKNQSIKNCFGGNSFIDRLCILHKNTLLFSLCNKLFKNEVIQKNNIRFEKMVWREDATFIYQYLSCINSVSFAKKPLYHYITYVNERVSATGKFVPNYYRDVTIKLFKAGMKFCNKWKDDKSINYFIQCQYDHYISEVGGDLIVNLARSTYTKKEKLAYISYVLNCVKKEKFKVKLSHFKSTLDKISAVFIFLHFSHGMLLLEEIYKNKKR